ncbi:MAG: hypothetical protein K2M06_07265 [Muribaculaceae bacterium]|nr:hypothetical protein [Muribaculaceae bacterium]
MTKEIAALLQLNVEMEGLLRVLGERDNPHAIEALARKAAEFDAKVQAFLGEHRPTIVKEDEAVAPEMEDSFDAADRAFETSHTFSEASPIPPQTVRMPRVSTPSQQPSEASSRPRVDLSKVFSLNDRFRYTGELFEGNTKAYMDAIAAMSSMTSFAQVLEYLTGQLGMDLSDPVAKEFADRVADNMPK